MKRIFVLHTEEPRFLAEVLEAPEGPLLEPTWFDSPDTLDVLIGEAADVANVPAVVGVPVGHIDDQWTIPIGADAELDADMRTLTVRLS